MKAYRYILLMLAIVFTGCASQITHHTKIQTQIQSKQDRIERDGRALLAKAESMLSKMSQKDANFAQALDVLQKSKALLGVTAADEEVLKHTEGAALTSAVIETYQENVKVMEKIDVLKDQQEQVVSDLVTEQIKIEAVNHYKTMQRLKWAAIITVILAALGAVAYFVPLTSLPAAFSFLRILTFWRK